jgi:hypothetical protein
VELVGFGFDQVVRLFVDELQLRLFEVAPMVWTDTMITRWPSTAGLRPLLHRITFLPPLPLGNQSSGLQDQVSLNEPYSQGRRLLELNQPAPSFHSVTLTLNQPSGTYPLALEKALLYTSSRCVHSGEWGEDGAGGCRPCVR